MNDPKSKWDAGQVKNRLMQAVKHYSGKHESCTDGGKKCRKGQAYVIFHADAKKDDPSTIFRVSVEKYLDTLIPFIMKNGSFSLRNGL